MILSFRQRGLHSTEWLTERQLSLSWKFALCKSFVIMRSTTVSTWRRLHCRLLTWGRRIVWSDGWQYLLCVNGRMPIITSRGSRSTSNMRNGGVRLVALFSEVLDENITASKAMSEEFKCSQWSTLHIPRLILWLSRCRLCSKQGGMASYVPSQIGKVHTNSIRVDSKLAPWSSRIRCETQQQNESHQQGIHHSLSRLIGHWGCDPELREKFNHC